MDADYFIYKQIENAAEKARADEAAKWRKVVEEACGVIDSIIASFERSQAAAESACDDVEFDGSLIDTARAFIAEHGRGTK